MLMLAADIIVAIIIYVVGPSRVAAYRPFSLPPPLGHQTPHFFIIGKKTIYPKNNLLLHATSIMMRPAPHKGVRLHVLAVERLVQGA